MESLISCFSLTGINDSLSDPFIRRKNLKKSLCHENNSGIYPYLIKGLEWYKCKIRILTITTPFLMLLPGLSKREIVAGVSVTDKLLLLILTPDSAPWRRDPLGEESWTFWETWPVTAARRDCQPHQTHKNISCFIFWWFMVELEILL